MDFRQVNKVHSCTMFIAATSEATPQPKREAVTAAVILTHFVGVKVTHLG
jgi:hypothetical protein